MFTLAIDDVVEVPVKFTLKAGKVNKPFRCTLICKRLDQDEIAARFNEVEFKYKAFLETDGLVTGWADQNLVLDASTGAPAEFSPEALGVFLKTAGVAQAAFTAYQKESGAKEKN